MSKVYEAMKEMAEENNRMSSNGKYYAWLLNCSLEDVEYDLKDLIEARKIEKIEIRDKCYFRVVGKGEGEYE